MSTNASTKNEVKLHKLKTGDQFLLSHAAYGTTFEFMRLDGLFVRCTWLQADLKRAYGNISAFELVLPL